ncbi:MAG: PQQ-binding-like beta-propeller repeat protein [bacterium]|nr:PQQ-binding-like beta-propeller repeat protein [bacterium]
MKLFNVVLPLALACAIFVVGCSGSGASSNPVTLDSNTGITGSSENVSHSATYLWGYYDVYIDIPTQTATAVPNRLVMFTANIVKILNGKEGALGCKINAIVTGSDYVDVDVDLSLTHPFPGLPQYTGYDLRGVFMGDGSASFIYNSDLIYPVLGTDQFMLADPVDGYGGPDGYTRWFNKPEFSTGGMLLFQYTPGKLTTTDFNGNATLNPYKYFADNLGVNDDLWGYLKDHADQHGQFGSGATNTRNYYLRFPNDKGFVFSTAFLANWKGTEPQYHPSNAPEAVACKVVDTSDVWYGNPTLKGGAIKLDISLWDWDSIVSGGVMEDYKISIESSVLSSVHEFTTSEMTPIGGDGQFSTYHVEIPADSTPGLEGNEYWVIVEQAGYDYNNDFGVTNLAGADPLSALFRYDLSVSDVVPAWITVVSPNGGEEWKAGTDYNITWTSQAVAGPVSIEYSKDNFVSDIHEIITSTENDGVYQWNVPNNPSSTVRVRITDTSNPSVYDISDNDFTIKEKSTLKILVPNGGEIWDVDSTYEITWESTGDIANVKMWYSKDNFVSDFHLIVTSTENDGVYEWQVPNDPSSTVRVGMVDLSTPSVYDISDNDFTIKGPTPTITVLTPNGGESWTVSSNHNITWESTGDIAAVSIWYSKDNFVSDVHEIIDSTENDGVFLWNVPNDPSSTVKVGITDTSTPSVNDISDNDFTIGAKPTLKILSPNGGEVWYVNSTHNITWESDGDIAAIRIMYSKDNFVSDFHEIIDSTENDGVFQWEVPDDPSSTVRVGIVDTSDVSVYDISDNNFTIKMEPIPTSLYWTQFMHDPSHGGRSGAIGPQTNNYIWTHEEGFSSDPSYIVEGYDGTIYYGGGDPGSNGKVWGVNPDGSTKWTYNASPSGGWATPLGVSADDSVLYVGTDNSFGGPFPGGRITGVDTSNGQELWGYDSWDFNDWFFGSNSGLILNSGDLVTFGNFSSGGPGQSSITRIDQYGQVKWSKVIGFNWWSTPAQGPDGTIYVNVQPFFGSPKIIALDPDTGVGFNHFDYDYNAGPFPTRQTCVAVSADGKIFFGAGSTIFCLNSDMTLAWSISSPTGILEGAIGIGPDNQIYVHDDTYLFALNSSGTPIWAKLYPSNWKSPAIGADGTIYIGTDSGIDALNPTNGNPIWTYSDNPAAVPIIAHDGSLYVILLSKLTKFGI